MLGIILRFGYCRGDYHKKGKLPFTCLSNSRKEVRRQEKLYASLMDKL